jgi:hypothetical protein
MTHLRSAIREAKWLADVHVFIDRSVQERSVDIKPTEFKVAGGRNGEEESETGYVNGRGESLRIVEACALAAAFGHEPGFEAGDITQCVKLYLVVPHVVDDHSVGWKVDEFPSANCP